MRIQLRVYVDMGTGRLGGPSAGLTGSGRRPLDMGAGRLGGPSAGLI
jgi:hypothetical protein